MLRPHSIPGVFLCSLLLLPAFTPPVTARELWLAPEGRICYQAPCACDKHAPCAINQLMFNQLQPGDTVNLRRGRYPGFVFADVHGTAEQKIVIRGEGISLSRGVQPPLGENPEQEPAAHLRGDLTSRQDAIELARSSHIVIENLLVSHARRAGIRLNNSHHIEIKNTLLRENDVWGIFTNHANHFTAQGNTIIGPAEQHGIYQSNSGDHVRITGNYIIDFDGCGLHFNGDLSMGGAPGVEGDGIISDVVISNNFIAGNGLRGGSAINLDGVENVLIENNILLGNKASGIAVFKHDGTIGSRDVRMRHNLVVMAPESRWAVVFNHSGTGNQVANNVFVAQNTRRGIYDANNVQLSEGRSGPIGALPFSASNNRYYYSSDFAVLNNSRKLSLAQWKRLGYEPDSRFVAVNGPVIGTNNGSAPLPTAITQALENLDVAGDNPYRHLLGCSRE